MKLVDFVALVQEKPRTTAELAELSGYPEATVEKVLAKLAAEGLVHLMPPAPAGEPS